MSLDAGSVLSVPSACARSILLAAAVAVVGCEQESSNRYPPPPDCPSGVACISNGSTISPGGGVGSGGGGSGGSSGGNTTGATADLVGTVHLVSAPSFTDEQVVFTGSANITGVGPSGRVSTTYGGSAGTTFDLAGLTTGSTWILVQDPTGASNVLSTQSPVTLPDLSTVVLPVVELFGLVNIASALPSAPQISTTTGAQVILTFTHAMQPYQGLSVTGGTQGAVVAYDTGGAGFSDQLTKTGTAGMVILFNAGTTPGQLALELFDASAATTYSVTVPVGAGTATVARFDL